MKNSRVKKLGVMSVFLAFFAGCTSNVNKLKSNNSRPVIWLCGEVRDNNGNHWLKVGITDQVHIKVEKASEIYLHPCTDRDRQ